MKPKSFPYWLEVPVITGDDEFPKDGGIIIIGSGLTGVSVAYWLYEMGFTDITLVDFEPEKSASFRNCGHILYGTVESMKALASIHTRPVAEEIWKFSIDVCHEVRSTVRRLSLDADYLQEGYLVIAIDETEDQEIKESIALLNDMGFQSDYVDRSRLAAIGFKNIAGGRFEAGSAQAHPVKFRNGLLAHSLKRGLKYHSGFQVTGIEEKNGKAAVTISGQEILFDSAVICANAYSPLLSQFYRDRRLVEPFRGQIIASKPLKNELPLAYPHSFDHGYEYALRSRDNRLIIGGWRNHTPHGETGTYDINPNPTVENGLKEFVSRHYQLKEDVEWEYSWAGIMASSRTSFPFIGPTNSPVIFTCAGYTGHGFSWAHGSAKLLAKIMAGEPIPGVAKYFNPTIL